MNRATLPRQEPVRMEEYELEEIKREIVESRSLTIKTNNLVNALAADLKSIAKRQQGYERRFLVNSATAYVVTIAVLFVLVKFAWDAKVETVRAETKESREKLVQIEKELRATQGREESTSRSARQAAEFYELIRQEKRSELIDGYDEVVKLPLTRTERAVFEAGVERARNELSLSLTRPASITCATRAGTRRSRRFANRLRYKSDAAHSPQATYQLARALRALGRQREAIPMLMQLSEASADKEVMDEATLLLAEAQIEIQAWNDAKNTLRAFLRRFPTSALVNDARMKLADVQLYH